MRDSRESMKKEIDILVIESKSIFGHDKSLKTQMFEYQSWYTKAIKIIEILLPERLDEFNRLYKIDKTIPSGSSEHYTIRDYLLDKYTFDKEVSYNNMCLKFSQQVAILESAQTRIDYLLADIKGVLQADLFDNELEVSESLLKAKYYRAAGTLAGVVLESHLGEVCSNHGIKFKKKNLTISDYNDELKNKEVLYLPKWRKIQALADIRNLCSHKKEREPTSDDVKELIEGVQNIIKTVF